MMDKKTYYNNLTVSSSPHLVTSLDTSKTMMMVLFALVPSLVMSVVVFGYRPIVLTAVCMAACAFFEYAYGKLMKKTRYRQGSQRLRHRCDSGDEPAVEFPLLDGGNRMFCRYRGS